MSKKDLLRYEAWKKKAAAYAEEIQIVVTGDLFTDEDLYDVVDEAKLAFDAGTSPKDFIEEAFAEDIAEEDMYQDQLAESQNQE